MNNFEIMGQAQLDAAEGQRMLALAIMKWLRTSSVKLVDSVGRHLPQGKATPW